MDAVSHTDGAITLLIPDCDSVGHARLIHIPIDSKPMQTKVIDVFGKKEDFQFVTLASDASYAAFASLDGTKFRVINLTTLKL